MVECRQMCCCRSWECHIWICRQKLQERDPVGLAWASETSESIYSDPPTFSNRACLLLYVSPVSWKLRLCARELILWNFSTYIDVCDCSHSLYSICSSSSNWVYVFNIEASTGTWKPSLIPGLAGREGKSVNPRSSLRVCFSKINWTVKSKTSHVNLLYLHTCTPADA